MKNIEIRTVMKSCSLDELSRQDRQLVDAACKMTDNSYAPYSHFRVGAAILMANGEIVCGSNQENAAFPSGTCAERTACFYASARYPGVEMKKIAIAARSDMSTGFQRNPIAPCGACRQSLLEYENKYGPIEVILYGADEIFILPSIASLLPVTFREF